MSLRRRKLNIVLLIAALILGGWAAWIYRRPPLVLSSVLPEAESELRSDMAFSEESPSIVASDVVVTEMKGIDGEGADATPAAGEGPTAGVGPGIRHGRVDNGTRIGDVEVRSLVGNSSFAKEAMKVLNGGADEADSVSRHRILSYCEHLRTAYTTRDIDFIRQVFSEDALIIVGQVVKPDARRKGTGVESGGGSSGIVTGDAKVKYSVRSKREYIERLQKLFNSGKEIEVKFSDFRIMRHPTLPGIYGVTLRQGYKGGEYEDEGYLFLLWDFRDRSMPLIHVRTWQPAKAIQDGEDVIDISDFNLGG